MSPADGSSWKSDPSSPVSAYFSSVNHGKEHLHLNLKSAEARKDFDALLAKADVLISNHMAQDAEKLGLTRDRLRALNPTSSMATSADTPMMRHAPPMTWCSKPRPAT